MQIGGDYNRFADVRQLALRLSPIRHTGGAEIFYQDWPYETDCTYDQDKWFDPDDDWWAYCEDGWYMVMNMRSRGTSATMRSPGTMSLRMDKKDKPVQRRTSRRTTLALVSTTARKVEKARIRMGASTAVQSGTKWQIAQWPAKASPKAVYTDGQGICHPYQP